ncbi:hypothetical protein GQ473_04210 [archaeon]|nr:hypothetical protein [archaeon]
MWNGIGMTLIRTYNSKVNTLIEDRLKSKRIGIVNGCIRCIVFKDRSCKDTLDTIYNENNISDKVKLLRILHESSTDIIKLYIIKISLMLYYIDDEIKFIQTFNKLEEMLDMPAAIEFECKLKQYK